ncbi:CinA family protein [Qipengyuania pelagi]|jgi:nicotinamide-nucleotide amidase|uniref:Nicotinamide-nucleotide amidohydrolase family protein n=1 Tax=Qipengyuania pelagi TaxID=994320 RepID=A0A844Y8U6_9SPHN|nr:CinA family protein [Qipengyuania pelagi]MXO53402.1 nicotinamide-nucleotide amidohydrolase family protein [Qipengyuania pelagi]
MTYGLLPEDIEALARKVVEENAQAGRTVALAESCTGGLVAAALTEVPGSSSVFDRSFVTYSNAAKREMLGVPSEIIETFGAVSIACVWAMAKGALERSGADVAVAISGVAGPSGGTTLKPVGTVVFARVTRNSENTPDGELKLFDGPDRAAIRKEAALWALELLLPKQREDAGASAD